uniref:Uncharacterized protein n=1 Tax=Arundo donax TaxID=35708 RepID=A0A0A9BPD1_ARUDO
MLLLFVARCSTSTCLHNLINLPAKALCFICLVASHVMESKSMT